MHVAYLHIPPFEDQGENRTKAETGNFIQSIQQLGEGREGRRGRGRREERRGTEREGGRREEEREGEGGRREEEKGWKSITALIHSTCGTQSGSHDRLLSPGHSESLPLSVETLTEDSPKKKGRRGGRKWEERERGR